MKRLKQLLSFLLAWIMVCALAMSAGAASGGLSLSELKQKYPDGSKWTSSFKGSYQCAGFARLLCYEAYGSDCIDYKNNSWEKYTNSSYIDSNLKAGDYVRYRYDGHSVFVVGVSGDNVDIADCNFSGPNKVRWATIRKSDLKYGFTHVYSAPYALSGGTSAPPAPPSASGGLSLSTNALSINEGKIGSVTITVARAEKFTVGVEIGNSSICSGNWSYSSFKGSGSYWSNVVNLNGLSGGSTTVTFKLYDVRSNTLLDTKSLAFTVIPTSKELSVSQGSVTMTAGQSSTVKVSSPGGLEDLTFSIDKGSTGQYVCLPSWGNRNSTQTEVPLTLKANKAGTAKITVTMYKTGTKTALGSKTIDVSVKPNGTPALSFDKTAVEMELNSSATLKITNIAWNGAARMSMEVGPSNLCSGAIEKTSDTTATITLTGNVEGDGNIYFYMLDANENRLNAQSVSVKVKGKTAPPSITADRTSLSVQAGSTEKVKFGFTLNGAQCTADFAVNDSTVCSASWNESSANNRVLSVAGLKEGTTAITVALKDSNGVVLASKLINVTVIPKPEAKPTPLTITISPSNLQMDINDRSKALDISWKGTVPRNCCLSVDYLGDAVSHLSLLNKGTASRTLMFSAYREGSSQVNISIKNKQTGEILASSSATVTVKSDQFKPTITLNRSSVTLAVGEEIVVDGSSTGGTAYAVNFNYNGYNESTFPAEVIPISNINDANYLGVSLIGRSAGAGILTVELVDDYGNVAARMNCIVTVTGREYDIEPTDGIYSVQKAQVFSSAAGIEDDIEPSEDGEYSAQGTPGGSALVGYAASGSTNLTGGQSSSSGGSSENPTSQTNVSLELGTQDAANLVTTAPATGGSTGGSADTPTVGQAGKPAEMSTIGGGGVDESYFKDVETGKYYYEPIMWAQASGITAGITSDTLVPNGNCPRSQVVEFLWRALGTPEPVTSESPFTDVSSGDAYYKAVLWAYENNITSGTSKTEFSPDATCTRGQVMTFLWRTQGRPTVSGTNPFTDVASGAYYIDAVNWAVGLNITAGTSATKFSPNDLCTRAQILTFLHRCISGSGGKT